MCYCGGFVLAPTPDFADDRAKSLASGNLKKTYSVPHTSLQLPRVLLNLMRIADMTDADIPALYDAALDVGRTMPTFTAAAPTDAKRCSARRSTSQTPTAT